MPERIFIAAPPAPPPADEILEVPPPPPPPTTVTFAFVTPAGIVHVPDDAKTVILEKPPAAVTGVAGVTVQDAKVPLPFVLVALTVIAPVSGVYAVTKPTIHEFELLTI
jgi:hypothetical protein